MSRGFADLTKLTSQMALKYYGCLHEQCNVVSAEDQKSRAGVVRDVKRDGVGTTRPENMCEGHCLPLMILK